jgi:hypothetical protein
MRLRLIALLVLLVTGWLAGCSPSPTHLKLPPQVTVQAPVGPLVAGQTLHWSATISGGTAPYRLSWDFGGGGNPNTLTEAGQGSGEATASVIGIAGDWQGGLTVTDAEALSVTVPVSFHVGVNHAPVVDSAVFDPNTQQLHIAASDPDAGDTLTVTLTAPPGVQLDPPTHAGPAPLSFDCNVFMSMLGAGGTVEVAVSDGVNSATFPGGVRVGMVMAAADSLFAIPVTQTVTAGEPVRLVIATTVPANPIEYVNGIGLTVEDDAEVVTGSFNIGSPGGETYDPDGFWSAMQPTGFVFQPMEPLVPVKLGSGLARFDFNITPLGGQETTVSSGALFSIQLKFSKPGVKHFGFVRSDTVKRTYYSDAAGHEYYWGSIDNDLGEFGPTAVTVVAAQP